jgi:GT2 family glycosyltransferase
MPVNIDIIILSFAKNEELKGLTVQTIDTLLASEDPNEITFTILVIESNKNIKPYQYTNSTTIYPVEKFGFNKYLNLGINATNNNYVCLCNNDLIFHKGWASALLKTAKNINNEHWVLSPFCELQHRDFLDLKEPAKGYFAYFAGYCFFTNRATLKLIGPLDERIIFWYADMDFIELMTIHHIPHYLVPEAKVSHLTSQVTVGFNNLDKLKYTYYPSIYFRYKWKDKSILLYIKRMLFYWFQYIMYYF